MMHTYHVEQDFGIEELTAGTIENPLESYLIENHEQGIYLEHFVEEQTFPPNFIPARTVDGYSLKSMIIV